MTRQVCVLLALALACAPVLAQDDPPQPRRTAPKQEATLQNVEEGAAFAVSGATPDLPEGTSLHVTLAVDGHHDVPIEAAFFRVVVKQGRYGVRHLFPRALAPASYVGRVEMLMSEQSPAIARALRQKFGYGPEHREVVASTALAIGSLEEQDAFRRETLGALRAFLLEVKKLHERVVAAADAGEQAVADARQGFYDELKASVGALEAIENRFVVSPEAELIGQMQGAHNELTRYVRDHPQAPRRDLERVAQFLDTLLAGIDARLRR